MQVARRVIVPFQKYYSCLQELGNSEKKINNCCYLPLLIRRNMTLPSTSSRQHSNLESIVDVGTSMGLSSDDVRNAVIDSPELLLASPGQWEDCFSLLQNNGFSTRDCLGMVKGYPKLLVTHKDKIMKSFMHWRNCELGDKNLLSVLKYNPHFLCIEGREIETRLPLLKSLTSSKRLTALLKNSPDLMFQNWKEIQKKVAYIQDVMKIEEIEIVKSSALSLSADELMARHMFLVRTGVFTPVKPKSLPDEPNKNPMLKDITDSSAKMFATKVAGLTLEEFEVFQELYALERQNTEDESDLSDSDAEG